MVERQFVALKVVGSNPTSHPLVVVGTAITFFQQKKIKKKIFKKKHSFIGLIVFAKTLQNNSVLKNLFNYNYYKNIFNNNKNVKTYSNYKNDTPVNITLSQKNHNPKAVISCSNKNVNTFSVGSVVQYFKVKQGKYIRRSSRGLKIFLNFVKNIFYKKYLPKKARCLVFNVVGFDYNLISCKKNIKYFLQRGFLGQIYFIHNLKVSFTKKKDKRIKSIKKRLRKKILKNFLKKINVNK